MIFTLTIDKSGGHFGERPDQEQAVLGKILSDVAQAVGTSGRGRGEHPITLHGTVIGSWSFGADSHNG